VKGGVAVVLAERRRGRRHLLIWTLRSPEAAASPLFFRGSRLIKPRSFLPTSPRASNSPPQISFNMLTREAFHLFYSKFYVDMEFQRFAFKDPPWQIGFVKFDISGTVSRGFSAAFSGVCAQPCEEGLYVHSPCEEVLYVHSLMKRVIPSQPCGEDYACARRHYNGPVLILYCAHLVLQYCTHQLCTGSQIRLVGPSARI
jgi:hypothetical protein